MPLESLTVDAVLALAPDAAAAKAGQGVAKPGQWRLLGHDGMALWGECQGSGKDPYRVQVDLSGPAFKCSCPSRKLPCKHMLGLMILAAQGQAPAAARPDWVAEWHAARSETAAKREAKAAEAKPADPAALAKRAENRAETIDAGIEPLRLWLADIAREGLAAVRQRPMSHFDGLARRMIDAKAPGLAVRLRDIGSAAARPDWQRTLPEAVGLLHLLLSSWRRREQLDQDWRDELASQLGIPTPVEAVLARPPVVDLWSVLGQTIEEEGPLLTQRIWLKGVSTGRPALILNFAPKVQRTALNLGWQGGMELAGGLSFYPGTLALRAHPQAETEPVAPMKGAPDPQTIDAAMAGWRAALARQPWLERWPLVLSGVPVLRDGKWRLEDAGAALPLAVAPDFGWRLVAEAGGCPLILAGEWDRRAFRPLTAWPDGTPHRVEAAA